MNVALTKHQKEYIEARVRSGQYNSASEVLREALRYHEVMETNRDWLEQQIEEGIESPGHPMTKEFTNKWHHRLLAEREQRRKKGGVNLILKERARRDVDYHWHYISESNLEAADRFWITNIP